MIRIDIGENYSNFLTLPQTKEEASVAAPPARPQEMISPLAGCLTFLFSRLKGTVILKIWPACLFMLVHTVVVLYLHNYVEGMRMSFSFSLVRILAGPTGLLLVFRTNTAYDRYWEGRKIWGTMTYQIRSLTMSIWLGVDDRDKGGDDDDHNDNDDDDDLDKVQVLNLLVAFVYATKNHLRGEYSYEKSEIKDLIRHIPRFADFLLRQDRERCSISSIGGVSTIGSASNTSSTSIIFSVDGSLAKNGGVNNNRNSCKVGGLPTSGGGGVGVGGAIVGDDVVKSTTNRSRKRQKMADPMKAHDFMTPNNIPLEIIYRLFSYLQILKAERRTDAITIKCLQASLLSLMDSLTAFERILKTPIPIAYSIHLRFTLWLFLLALPYQFAGIMNWWTIPTVLISCVVLLGILAIGGEIENPFGYDENDLPLDDFCNVIRREIQVMIARSERAAAAAGAYQRPSRLKQDLSSQKPKVQKL